MKTIVALLFGLLLGSTLTAGAQAPDPEHRVRLGASAVLASGAPVGLIGVELEVEPMQGLSLSLGLGRTLEGLQVAAIARYLVLDRAYVGLGLSTGRYVWHASFFDSSLRNRVWERAYWASLEVGFDGETEAGFFARPFVGLATTIDPRADRCTVCDESGDSGSLLVIWYLGLGLGWRFTP